MEESDAHDQQIHHERWQHSLCILQEAVLFARWLRRILAGVKRRALLFRVLCGRTISGSAYGLVFRSYGHPFNPTVTIRPEPTADSFSDARPPRLHKAHRSFRSHYTSQPSWGVPSWYQLSWAEVPQSGLGFSLLNEG